MRKTETILEILRKELRDGIYPAATRFPSEMKLMSRFSAARLTINKITEQLVLEGFLERRKQGGGTFVREPNPFPLGHIAYLGPINNLYYSSMLDAIQRTTFLKGYALTIFSPGERKSVTVTAYSDSRYISIARDTVKFCSAFFIISKKHLNY